MNSSWKVPALSALGGAAIAVAVIYAAAFMGALPESGDQIRGYIMAHPEVLADASDKYQEEEDARDDQTRQDAVNKLGLKTFFNPSLAFVTGPVRARTTLVEFFDYNCPHCRKSVPAVQRFYNAHKSDARFAFIEFPIQGPQSVIAARAALAARRQPDKYVAFHFAMMNEDGPVDEDTVFDDAKKVGLDVTKLKADMNDPKIDATIETTMKLAKQADINGTPEFIVDGKSWEGEVDDARLNQMTKARVSSSSRVSAS